MTAFPRSAASEAARRGRVLAWLISLGTVSACGGDQVIVLGDGEPRPFRFGTPAVRQELSIEGRSDNPSLTADMLEIYFTAGPNLTQADVWTATRKSRSEAFDTPIVVAEVSTPGLETSPIVSADGLTLWVASDRAGGVGDLDIWVSTRKTRSAAWSEPRNVTELNSEAKDIPRPPGDADRIMPIASDRAARGSYRIYFAARADAAAAFQMPTLVSELSFPDESSVDGFLTDDGLTLFYVRGPDLGPADMFVASRRSSHDRFEHSVALSDLNSASDERDPFLSRDGREFFFSSDRSGRYEIYSAPAHRKAVELSP